MEMDVKFLDGNILLCFNQTGEKRLYINKNNSIIYTLCYFCSQTTNTARQKYKKYKKDKNYTLCS